MKFNVDIVNQMSICSISTLRSVVVEEEALTKNVLFVIECV